ncbi:leucine-rich repeat-containing protein 19-like isoform X2 [Channa argus]|uniref:leucine-rich repeat-containing protein 19-like isoform X2 n=1 Tax=Channa argus TaxID=215402 RepID=UPI00351FE25C
MERSQQHLLLLCLTAIVTTNAQGNITQAVGVDALVAHNILKVIPHNNSSSPVTTLVIEDNLITLNEEDRLALASYPTLVELHLNGNRVTAIPAKYFSVVPHLRVLSLSRNNISSLDPKAFLDLNVLTILDLSHNLLTSLPPALFQGLNNLQVLKLQENPWNCSCSLLKIIQVVKEANVTFGGPQLMCASPEKQAGYNLLSTKAVSCYPTPSHTFTTLDLQKPPTPVNSKQCCGSSTVLNTTRLSNQDYNINNGSTKIQDSFAWKHMEVHSMCSSLSNNYLHAHHICHQGAFMV